MRFVFALCVVAKCLMVVAAQTTADLGTTAGPTSPGGVGGPTAPGGFGVTDSPGATTLNQSSPVPAQQSVVPSAMQLTIVSMLVGQYSNSAQSQSDIDKNVTGPNRHARIEASYIPVVVSILSPAVVVYFEQRVNNETKPARQALYAFNQESPCLVRMSTLDIFNASRFNSTPEGLQALENLQPQELSNRPECDALWEQIGKEFFTCFLSTDQCTFEAPGGGMMRPGGSRNLTCFGMTFFETWKRVPGGQAVGGTSNPYVMQKIGNLYPVPVQAFSANTCFIVPCSNNGGSKPTGPTWSDIKDQLSYTKKNGN